MVLHCLTGGYSALVDDDARFSDTRKETAERWGRYLRDLMSRRPGLSGRKLAAYAGLSPNTVNLWLRGVGVPEKDSLLKMAAGLRMEPIDLFRAAGLLGPEDQVNAIPPDIPADPFEVAGRMAAEGIALIRHRIPIQEGFAHAGAGGLDEGWIYPQPQWIDRKIFAIRIRGRCMEPAVRPGDILVVDLDGDLVDGGLVVATYDDEVIVRAYDAATQTLFAASEEFAPLPLSAVSQVSPVLQIMKDPPRMDRRHVS